MIDKMSRMKSKISTDPKVLQKLAHHEDWVVRINVAQNPHTDKSTLMFLSDDPVWEVVAWLPDNINCPKEVYDKLSDSSDADVLYYLVNSSLTPWNIIKYVLEENKNADLNVKITAIKSGKIPYKILEKYVNNSNSKLRDVASQQMQLYSHNSHKSA